MSVGLGEPAKQCIKQVMIYVCIFCILVNLIFACMSVSVSCVCGRAHVDDGSACAYVRDPDWDLVEAQAFVPEHGDSIDTPYDTRPNSVPNAMKGCVFVCARSVRWLQINGSLG
jgi:hypothetical protein